MRKTLSLVLYMALVEVIAVALVVCPVYAFTASQSTTGYVRTLNASGASAMFSAQRPAQLTAVANAASAGGSSLAIRMVAGLGWAGLGVAAGLLLYQLYYSPADLQALKDGATVPGPWSIPGYAGPIQTVVSCPGGADCAAGYDQAMTAACTAGNPGTGWQFYTATGTAPNTVCHYRHIAGSASSLAQQAAGAVPTAQQINDWLSTIPANDPLSVPAHTTSAGVGVQPQPADQVVNQPVPATQVTTQVVPASTVTPSDVVVNPNAPPPAGPLPVQNGTQSTTTTTTTTTVTNPDGSTTSTDTQTDTAPVQCNAGNHEQRTFGGILQDHLDLWQGSGLLSALNLLKTLTWPTTIPTYSLQSNLFGTFTLDFSAWSGMLTALRSIIIAIAGFVAYKIVFVGAR
ncbi:MAG: hypothetical protein Q7U76_04010 [Nitrospirota bacterium]|nr:hypothetical protein [Nitrospirota bacterium]